MQGRQAEMAVIEELLGRSPSGGGALVLTGEAGVGKSTLLAAAVASRRSAGMAIRKVAGVPSEQHIPFSGLHRLLARRPPRGNGVGLLGRVLEVPPDGALEAPRVALAVLDALGDEAAERPVLVVAEDVQWLDPDSVDALAFVAQRLEWEPIVMLFALREGHPSPLADARLPELRVRPLPPADAEEVLRRSDPDLPAELRARILAAAAGNPLALTELPRAMTGRADTLVAPTSLPLTERLEEAFIDRIRRMPETTVDALLVAALDEAGDLGGQLQAASTLVSRPVVLDDLTAAEDASLIVIESGIRFRHPLIRSAVLSTAGAARRERAHLALAAAYVDDPARNVWHRAAAARRLDGSLARELAELGERSLSAGAPGLAGAAFERAAALTSEPAIRASLRLRSAEIAFDIGRPGAALALIDQARPSDLGPDERVRRAIVHELADEAGWSGAGRVTAFAMTAAALADGASPELAARGLLTAAIGCWWGNPPQATRDLVVSALDRLPLSPDHPVVLAALACADPVGQAIPVVRRIRGIAPDGIRDASSLHLIGTAASAVWAFDLAAEYLPRAVDGLRTQGRLASLAQALVSLCWTDIHRANAARALTSATEAARLGRETGQGRWAIAADIALAVVAGERGDLELAERLAAAADEEISPTGTQAMRAMARFARGRAWAAHQRYVEATEELVVALDPRAVGSHPFVGTWSLADLIESAWSTGDLALAQEHLAILQDLRVATDAPLVRAMSDYVTALLSPDDEAEARFREALDGELVGWPCYRTRLLLHRGRWLRRQRRGVDSRRPLRMARDAADALGYQGLAELARRELRASGEASKKPDPLVIDRLTPQEMQIVELAAEGLSNREIGERLFLSHRTVASHLYRAFPKLGITARSELAAVLPAASVQGLM